MQVKKRAFIINENKYANCITNYQTALDLPA